MFKKGKVQKDWLDLWSADLSELCGLFPWVNYSYESIRAHSKVEDGKKILEVEVPGYDKEDLALEEDPEGLILSFKDKKRENILLLVEKTEFDIQQIQATCKNGILRITILPKTTSFKKEIKIE